MNWAQQLRESIRQAAERYARAVPHYASRGGVVLFHPYDGNRHGNFHPDAYAAILAAAAWPLRLEKRHAQAHALPEEWQAHARELDSSTSSDALLMNLFCFPGFIGAVAVRDLLGLGEEPNAVVFGEPGCVPLSDGSFDRTEIDCRVGDLLLEAKLTEADFTTKPKAIVQRYRDFEATFDVAWLPQTADAFLHYQLLRNVLAARAQGRRFSLACDARRPDLVRAWWQVMAAIREPALRACCGLVFWQELVAAAPAPLASFVSEKYGLGARAHD